MTHGLSVVTSSGQLILRSVFERRFDQEPMQEMLRMKINPSAAALQQAAVSGGEWLAAGMVVVLRYVWVHKVSVQVKP